MCKLIIAAKKFSSDESAATMMEYALMIAFVAAACVVAVTSFGTAVSGEVTKVAGSV